MNRVHCPKCGSITPSLALPFVIAAMPDASKVVFGFEKICVGRALDDQIKGFASLVDRFSADTQNGFQAVAHSNLSEFSPGSPAIALS